MKNKLVISLLCLLVSHSAFAGISFEFVTKEEPVKVMNEFFDHARVLLIERVYSDYVIRESSQECYITEYRESSTASGELSTNAFLTGVVGGMIGNQIGDGDGKKAATLIGFLLGVKAAQDQEAQASGATLYSREVCEQRYPQSVVSGAMFYRITYVYQDQLFSYISKAKPYTDIIKVRVNVAPIDDYIVGIN
ncbi:MAG: hypothetical protein NZ775_03940 [Gammaproteobacteria bacterium]|nr:hypothetical protein [Gammaproteobacteria bacterium]